MKKIGCLTYFLIISIISIGSLMLAGVMDSQLVSVPDDHNGIYEPDDQEPDDHAGDGQDDFSENDQEQDTLAEDDPGYEETKNIEDNTEDDTSQNHTVEEVFYAYYEQLNAEEKSMYDVILEGAQNGKKSFKFKNVDCQQYSVYSERVVFALTYDHPELFWLRCGYTIRKTYSVFEGTGDIELDLDYYSYWEYSLDKNNKREELERAVNKVAALALEQKTDYDRIQYVHDYLVENAFYDYDSLNSFYNTFHDASCEYIFSAYGCLVNGRTVCAGYAKAFQLIMQKLGYDCMYVVGDAGGSHAWNCIYIENEGYYVDVTWDDPDYEDYEEAVLYNYFNLTGNEFLTTHTPDKNFEIPECDALKYNYYRHENRYLDSYEFEAFCKALEGQEDFQVVTVRLADKNEMEEAVNDIFGTGNRYHEIPYFGNIQGSYAYDEEFNIIYIFYE